MTPRQLKDLAERCANQDVVLSEAEREQIADYLLDSCPMKTVDQLMMVADKLIRSCESRKLFYELCMNMRVRIATLTLKWKTLRYTNFEEIHSEELETSPFPGTFIGDVTFDHTPTGVSVGEAEGSNRPAPRNEESGRSCA